MADCSKTVEFIREYNRMCDARFCKDCPMNRSNRPKTSEVHCGDFVNKHPRDAIAIVQKWSDEHPAMTWESKLREMLPYADIEKFMRYLCPRDFFGKNTPSNCGEENFCSGCWAGEYKEENNE